MDLVLMLTCNLCLVRFNNDKFNKMKESIIIQKMISIGQHLEREEIFYSGAEADARALLEEIKQALNIDSVSKSACVGCGDEVENYSEDNNCCDKCWLSV